MNSLLFLLWQIGHSGLRNRYNSATSLARPIKRNQFMNSVFLIILLWQRGHSWLRVRCKDCI